MTARSATRATIPSIGGVVVASLWLAGCPFAPPGPEFFDEPGADAGPGDVTAGSPDRPQDLPDAGPPTDATIFGKDGGSRDAVPPDAGPLPEPFIPANGIPADSLTKGPGIIDTAVLGSLVFDTDTGAILGDEGQVLRTPAEGVDSSTGVGFFVHPLSNGSSMGVFMMGSLRVTRGTTLRGRGAAAWGLVSGDEVIVDGRIDASGGASACSDQDNRSLSCAGPGGRRGAPSCTPCCDSCRGLVQTCSIFCPPTCTCEQCERTSEVDGRSGNAGFGACYPESGGGGGGHGGAGGRGGDADGSYNYPNGVGVPGGEGGLPYGDPSLEPLTGGGGGGGGGDEPQEESRGGVGGGGGGALQISARRRVVLGVETTAGCGIDAGGAGGAAGEDSAAGGGGGAGGGVLIEAPEVIVHAGCGLSANGGGGGGSSRGADGDPGPSAPAPAQGGPTGGGCNSGDGAPGGAQGAAAEDALSCPLSQPNCEPGCFELGGGGGGVGRIRFNADRIVLDGFSSPMPNQASLPR